MNPVRNYQSKKNSLRNSKLFKSQSKISNGVKKNGFTLSEVLVVTAIIAIFSTATLISLRVGARHFALENAAHGLGQDLRKIQAMAMAAQECPLDKCGGPPAIIPSRYGIELEKDKDYYIVFADLNDNGRYEPGISDIEIEKVTFEKGIKIQALLTPNAKTTVWVTFKPPDPLTTIRDLQEYSTLRIQLISIDNQTKVISLNQAGLIAIE